MRERLFSLLLALVLTLSLPVSALAEGGGAEPGPEPQTAEESLPPEETPAPKETEGPEQPEEPEESPEEPGPSEQPEDNLAPVEELEEEAEGEGEILLAAAALSGPCGAEGDNVTWSIADGVLTFSGSGRMQNYGNVEAGDYGYSGEYAPPWSEYRDQIARAVVNEGVTNLGDCALYDCSMVREISLPDSLTEIGSCAVRGIPNIPEVTIPRNVSSIGRFNFIECSILANIWVAEGNPVYASLDGVLCSRDLTALLCYPRGRRDSAYRIPEGVTEIGASAFGSWTLRSVTCSESVRVIGESAFERCSELEEAVLTDHVTELGKNAFSGCTKLKKLTLSNSLDRIESGAFYHTALRSVTIPEGVTSIGSQAFANCDKLTEVTIPNTVASIEYGAFSGCSALLSATVPTSVQALGALAFDQDELMTDLFILSPACEIGDRAVPSTVTIHGEAGSTAEDYAAANGNPFQPLGAEQDQLIASGVCGLRGSIIWEFTKDGVLTLSGSGDMGYSGYGFEKYIKQIRRVVVEDGISSIGNNAFQGAVNLKEVQLPDSVTEIRTAAFGGCELLTELRLPAGLKTIGKSAFSSCQALKQVQLPEGLTRIMDSAFSACENLAGLKLPDSLVYLGEGAFYECKSLTEIYIPANVVSIGVGQNTYGMNAFDDSGIQAIEVDPENRAYQSKDGVLFNKAGTELLRYPQAKSDASYTIPDGVTRIANYAFFDCRELKELRFPAGLQEIGDVAFYFCTGLKRLDLPEGLTKIADYAFYGCEGVEELNLPSTVITIGEQAFSFNAPLQSVTIPASVEVLGMGTFNLVDMEDLFILSPTCVIGEDAVWPTVTIHGYPGSTAEKYAAANGNPFVPIEEPSPSPVPSLTVEAQSGEGAPAVDFQMEDAALADAVLTAEEKAALAASGGRLELLLTVEDAAGTVTASEKRAAEAAAGEYRIGQYLDIALFKTLNGATEAVHETGTPLRITVQIPEALLGTAYRSFALLRIHDGKAEFLPDLDRDPKTLTVETDRFSSYAIIYLSKVYNVRFDPNGGKSDTESLQTREDGRLPSLPQATREKLSFSGWYTAKEGGAKVTADTVFDSDAVLYAHWSTAPATGDAGDPALWAGLMAASLPAALVLLRKRERSKENAK